ncbi:zinc finger protein 91 [Strongylocentrotus purpuratus]|uniref:C2H2-type domain-containing protein n=1 Tax=Strongylocentrotus purpuratus TaxID=7668 RepID=A0A7M7SV92_STRPU|nr:zinc finger protein 91 [Strongylocentrotus purpuratus]
MDPLQPSQSQKEFLSVAGLIGCSNIVEIQTVSEIEVLGSSKNVGTPSHETKFQCSACAKAFRLESQLLRHKNTHRGDSRRPVVELLPPYMYTSLIDEISENSERPRKKAKKEGSDNEETVGWRFKILGRRRDRRGVTGVRGNQQEGPKSAPGWGRESTSSTKDLTATEDLTAGHTEQDPETSALKRRAKDVNSVKSGQLSSLVSAPEISPAKDSRFPCGLCSERFSSSAKLKKHMFVHSGFSCDECGGLAFASNAALRRHLLVHSEKPKKSQDATSSATKKSTKSPSFQKPKKGRDATSSATKKRTKSLSKSKDSKSLQKGQPSAVAPKRAIGAGVQWGVFPCNHCDKVFSRPNQLKFHMIAHSNVSCVLCDGLTFTSNEEFRRHLITHSGQRWSLKREKDYSQSLTSNGNTESPKKSVKKRIHCSVCKKSFARPCYLRKHMVVSDCASKKALKAARRKKYSPKSSGAEGKHESPQKEVKERIYCSLCDKGFSRPQRLWKHMVVHGYISDKPAETLRSKEIGPRSSSPKESINSSPSKEHKSVKSGQTKRSNKSSTSNKPLPVPSRQPKGRTKSSTAKELMPAPSRQAKKSKKPLADKGQMPVASGQVNINASGPVGSVVEDKPFPCILCSKKFSKLSQLRIHKASVHSDYNCDRCDGLSFPSREQLSSHMLIHAMQLKCPLCDAMYSSQNTLLEHIATHSDPVLLICEICSSTFHSLKSLKMHQIMDHSQSILINTIETQEKEKRELVKKKRKKQRKKYNQTVLEKIPGY